MSYRYLLLVRFILINAVAAGIACAIYLQGWLDGMFVANTIEFVTLIAAVFVYGLVICTAKVWRTCTEINDIRSGDPAPDSRAGKYFATIYRKNEESRTIGATVLRAKLTNRITGVRHIANTLVLLGLIGTVVGFIISLSAVTPNASDSDTIAPVIAQLINGMSVALYTTLIGSLLHIWLVVDHRILTTGTINLYSAIIELGENRGRA
ncbi:MAG: MotA/TolQ/ExbB proton channel family protein [Alphaproteobacteria bacterium]